MELTASPYSDSEDNDIFFDIVNVLCNRFMALTPFMIYNTYFDEVMELYVDCVIHDNREKNRDKDEVWVTSKNATWH